MQPDPTRSEFIQHLRLLRCLAAVAQYGSTVRAAEAMHVTQPAVTRGILELERLCGLQLFERAARGMVANKAGERMGSRASGLLEHLERGAEEAAALASGRLRRVLPRRFAWTVPSSSLRAFVAVAAEGSEARAAQSLGISQPAIHRALRTLEDLAGVTLMQKSARGTWLTHGGSAMLRRVKLAIAETRAIEVDLSAWSGALRGDLVIGVLPLSAAVILPRAIEALRHKHPGVALKVVDGTYENLVAQLLSADVDVIVGALRGKPPAEVAQVRLFEDELAVIARPGHPCLAGGTSLQELLRWPWVSPLPMTPARAALDRAFSAEGLAPPEADVQANSPAMTLAMVLAGDRLALMSRRQAEIEQQRGAIRIAPVVMQGTTREIGAAVRAAGEPSPDLRAMLGELHAAAFALAPPGQ